MSFDERRGVALVAGAALVGVAGDLLLRGHGTGVNVVLFASLFLLALTVIVRVGRVPLHQGRRWMAFPVLLFSALFAVHRSPLLLATNTLALAGAVSLGALRRGRHRPSDATVGDYASGLVSAGAGTFVGSIELLEHDVRWESLRRVPRSHAATFGRGLAIGAPFLLVFGVLFAAADTVFRRLAASAVPSVPTAWPHVLFALGIAWVGGGLLRDLAADRDEARIIPASAVAGLVPRVQLGGAEIAIALVAVDLLFAAFVAVQARFLFGGKSVVLGHEHLTYAQYARHGFFELLAVSALVVPLVLCATGLARDRVRLVRALCAVLVVLELVVAASALQRMRVYVAEYGLTELRVYVTGVTLWICAVLLWALATAIYGNSRRFAIGAIVAGFAATLALNAIDPDALIARRNLDRGRVDPTYLSRLSDDAVPTLVARVPTLADTRARAALAANLLARRFDGDALGWNLAARRAQRTIAAHRAELRELAGR